MSGKGGDDQDGGADKGSLGALALATQLGFAVAVPLVVFIGLGVWADNQFGTKPWLFFLGLMLGIGSAGGALYQIATSIPSKPYKPPEKKPPTETGLKSPPSNKDDPLWAAYEPDDEGEDNGDNVGK